MNGDENLLRFREALTKQTGLYGDEFSHEQGVILFSSGWMQFHFLDEK